MFAQLNNRYPIEFGQFMNSYLLNNPASITSNEKINLNTGLLQYIGPFKGIRTFYGTFTYKLEKKYTHDLGINFISDQEGELISRNFIYSRYAIQIPLNQNYILSTGATLGLANYAFSGSTPNSIGADTRIDGNLGLWLKNKNFNIGFAINQFTNSSISPIEEKFSLSTFSTINADYKHSFNPYLNLKGYFINKIYSKSLLRTELVIHLEHYNSFIWGSGYKHNRGLTFYIGINKIPILDDKFHFMFSYFIPTFENQANRYNYLELNLSYSINSKQAK